VRDESWEGVAVDVRIDDDPEPLDRLERLLDVSDAYAAMRAGTAAAKSGDLGEAGRLAERAAALAPHDQNVVGWVAVVRAHAGDVEPLRELIARRPGTRRLLDWLRAHDEVRLSDEVMAQLERGR
jgi:thioredoxin-like negative regulator of GroEL